MGPAPGAKIGPYVVGAHVGSGGMGAVYRATEAASGREVALKLVPRTSDRDFAMRFTREATLAAAVRSPHVVAVHAHGEDDGWLWLATELVSGGSLEDQLKRAGPVAPREAARLGAEIALALAAVHGRGLVHRDLKPANLLLDEEGRVRLADFGLVRQAGAEAEALTRTGEVLGTYEYMAPEQAERAREVDGRADLYSLGCVLHVLVGGRPPFEGSGAELLKRHYLDAPPALSTRARGVPSSLDALVARLLAKAPEDRPASAIEVARALKAIAQGAGAGGLRLAPLFAAGAVAAVVVAGAVIRGRGAQPQSPPPPPPRARPALPPPPPPPPPTAPPGVPSWFMRLQEKPALPLQAGLEFGAEPGEYVNVADGSILVFVRGRSFTFGRKTPVPASPEGDAQFDKRFKEEKRVVVRSFFIGKYELSVRQYARLAETDASRRASAEAKRRGTRTKPSPDGAFDSFELDLGATSWSAPAGRPGRPRDDDPVTQVTWDEARAYSAQVGARLPTQPEWELAAGGEKHSFPWPGIELVFQGHVHANIFKQSDRWEGDKPQWEGPDGHRRTMPIDAFPDGKSPAGALNMAGNAGEICADEDREDLTIFHVLRGGSWATTWAEARIFNVDRLPQGWSLDDTGFRIVVDYRGP